MLLSEGRNSDLGVDGGLSDPIWMETLSDLAFCSFCGLEVQSVCMSYLLSILGVAVNQGLFLLSFWGYMNASMSKIFNH